MKNDQQRIIKGIGVAPGVAVGPAFIIEQCGVPVPEYEIPSAQVEKELKRLHGAIVKVQKHLSQLQQKAVTLSSGAEDMTLLLDAYKGMLSGSRLIRGVEEYISKHRVNAEAAIQKQINAIKADFAAMDDPYLAARAEDVGEVGTRLLRSLLQQNYNPFTEAPEGCVILAEEITPADAALLDPDSVVGFATVLGGAEGHAAIIARALGLPAISGVGALTHGIKTGDTIAIDGRKGEIVIHPDAKTLQHYKEEVARKKHEYKRLKSLRDVPAVTSDGRAISLQANMELPRDLDMVASSGATGVGLLRTEFLFMNRATLPDEEEQYQTLKGMVEKLDGLPLTVRTLDVGGEKLASALGPVEQSANPALGLRAIRLGLKRPDLLDAQLTAILRASMHGPIRILIPMVSHVTQMNQVRARVLQIEKKLHRRGIKLKGLPPLGAMIEIPSAALIADSLAKVCDFFSIGSNDLTQYTLAIDRGDDSVADLYDPFHPAILRLIQFTVAAAWRANIPVALCGEMAGDARATALLLGLGLRELSMSPLRLPAVKNEIMRTSLPQASKLAEQVMGKTNLSEIVELLQKRVSESREK
ncbi:MAG: phosphoenolpyruvate--protein phosphotransferase [Bdellovibrionales bacterium]